MLNYDILTRKKWKNLFQLQHTNISKETLQDLTSANDKVSIADVEDIYIPLIRYLELHWVQYRHLQLDRALFLNQTTSKAPFIIGIAGSVAVGKSTTARLLKHLLTQLYPDLKTDLVTTDGFLYPTAILKEKGILDKKGFPESYDMEALLNFLDDIKSGNPAKAPVYSHHTYDIVAGAYTEIINPDILIVEGINVLQNPNNQQIYMSDFFDFSIYIDADIEIIETWYLERFNMLLDVAKHNPDDYYYSYAIGNRNDAMEMAKKVWKNVNKRNLENYILPTKNRADLILHKSHNHQIDELYLKKY